MTCPQLSDRRTEGDVVRFRTIHHASYFDASLFIIGRHEQMGLDQKLRHTTECSTFAEILMIASANKSAHISQTDQ